MSQDVKMRKISLNARTLRENLKRGATTEYFLERCQCTVEEFHHHLYSVLYSNNQRMAKAISEMLEKNDEAAKRRASETTEEIETEAEVHAEFVATINPETESLAEKLKALQEKEAELSSELSGIDAVCVRLIRQRAEVAQGLRTVSESLEEQRQKIQKLVFEVQRLKEKNDGFYEKLTATVKLKAETSTRLEEVRNQIAELERPVIVLYADGRIAPFDENLTIEFNEAGFEQIYRGLVEIDYLEDLSVKQVKNLARFIAVMANLNFEVTPMFDDLNLEANYNRLKAEDRI